MTSEEAINRLKSDIPKYTDFLDNPNEDEFWEAFDMAIKALEQEPCEDAISREEFERRIKPYDTQDATDKALYNFAHNTLISCPSVQLKENAISVSSDRWATESVDLDDLMLRKVKTGHWKPNFRFGMEPDEKHFICSECGKQSMELSNYCPDCGKKMEEE